MTAGHCLSAGGAYGNPGERGTDYHWRPYHPFPYGKSPHKMLIPTDWENYGRLSQDFGFLIFKYPIMMGMDALGGLFNIGHKNRSWQAIGFPHESPFNNSLLYQANGTPYLLPYRGNPMGMEDNDMTGGSSGGPWRLHGQKVVNGLTSHSKEGVNNVMYSPYFNSDVSNCYDKALTLR